MPERQSPPSDNELIDEMEKDTTGPPSSTAPEATSTAPSAPAPSSTKREAPFKATKSSARWAATIPPTTR